MANGGDYHINDDDFMGLDAAKRDLMIFKKVNMQVAECEERFCMMERKHTELATRFDRRKRVDTQFAGTMGLVGGVIGYLGSKLFGVFK